MSNFKPLTPQLRADIQDGINKNLAELDTCRNTAYVQMQRSGLGALQNIINALPDGYPIPIEKRGGKG